MASLPGPSSPGRRLAELLQEQQEPFHLDVYLLEQGYSGRSLLCSDATATCWPGGACRRLQRFASHGFGRRRECILRSLLAAFALKRPPKASPWEALWGGGLSCSRKDRPTGSGLTSSSSAGEDAGELGKIKVDAQRTTHRWEYAEEAKQLSPVSVLEVKSDDGSPAYEHVKEEEESTPSGFCCPVVHLVILGAFHGPASSEHTRGKKELHGRRQALLARVDDGDQAERSNPYEKRVQHAHDRLGSRTTVTARRRQICAWRRPSADNQITTRALMESEISDSGTRWNQFQPSVREIGVEIGDAILRELIEAFFTYMTEPSVLTPAL